jgi:hypothetical protein
VPQAPAAAVAAGAVESEMKLDDLAAAVLSACKAE